VIQTRVAQELGRAFFVGDKALDSLCFCCETRPLAQASGDFDSALHQLKRSSRSTIYVPAFFSPMSHLWKKKVL
jgi:hypothetical protein